MDIEEEEEEGRLLEFNKGQVQENLVEKVAVIEESVPSVMESVLQKPD